MGLDYLPWHFDEARGDRPCFQDDDQALTYHQFAERVDALAAQLRDHGVGPGDVVAVMLPNRVELVLTIFAAWRLAATATPINPAFTAREAGYQLEDSGAKVVVNLDADAPDGGLPAIHVADVATTHPGVAELPPVPDDDAAREQIALLIYTSGSTGRPKGVMLDHANLEAMAAQMVGHFELTEDDHCLLILPLFHVNAIMVSVVSPISVGGRVTVMGRFAPELFLEVLEQVRPTYFSGVPAIFSMLAALPADVIPDTSSLRFAVCGAAPASAELLRAVEERFDIVMVEGYGLTEGTCASACNPVTGTRKIGTVGPAVDGQEIRIVGPHGDELPPGEPGEVVISGPTVMRGYLNRPEATAESIRDGWLHTGDVGYLDEDGYLTLVDRIKDMIIRGGENLYPKEIEATLYEVEGVLEVAVVGAPDEVMGEVPVAFVTPYPDAQLDVEQLRAHCRENLMRQKVPTRIELVGEIPKNPVGKIDKPALRETVQASPT